MAIGYGVGVAANEMNFVSSPGLSSSDFFFRYVSRNISHYISSLLAFASN